MTTGAALTAGPSSPWLALRTTSERVVDRSAHACFARAKHERDLGSARRLVVVQGARDTSRSGTHAFHAKGEANFDPRARPLPDPCRRDLLDPGIGAAIS